VAVIGAGGAFVELDEQFAIGSPLRLWFILSPLCAIECPAIVRNALEGQGVGVEFLDLELHDQALIQAVVEETTGSGAP
jgi:hypothetical protein